MTLKQSLKKLCYKLFTHLPLHKRKVLLFSYYGEQYSGSPKYISRCLEQDGNYRLVWAFVHPGRYDLPSVHKVKYGRLSYLYHLATAGFLITNYRMTQEFPKRKGQKYYQTWHSSLRLKMIEKDAEATLPGHYVQMAKADSRNIDYLLAGSKKSHEIFENAFWYSGKILDIGTPQCDVLLNGGEDCKQKVCSFFKLPSDVKIAIYAPTFRKSHDTSVYNLDTARLRKALEERFGGNWVILMRLHPHLVNKAGCFQYNEYAIAATAYDDVQELLASADALISDYSAIMFDFAVTGRPCFLYTPDLEDYLAHDRQLYFDIKALPWGAFTTNDALVEGIQNYTDIDSAAGKRFLEFVGSYDDGNACKRVVQQMEEDVL